MATVCVMAAGPRGTSATIALPLALVVELTAPYYVHGGYDWGHGQLCLQGRKYLEVKLGVSTG